MGTVLRLLYQAVFLVGPGLLTGAVIDKIGAAKVPNYQPALSQGMKDESGNFSPVKIAWFIAAAVLGTVIVKFIGKKLNIKILK